MLEKELFNILQPRTLVFRLQKNTKKPCCDERVVINRTWRSLVRRSRTNRTNLGSSNSSQTAKPPIPAWKNNPRGYGRQLVELDGEHIWNQTLTWHDVTWHDMRVLNLNFPSLLCCCGASWALKGSRRPNDRCQPGHWSVFPKFCSKHVPNISHLQIIQQYDSKMFQLQQICQL